MNDELFPLDSICMDSPRLRWMKKHCVETLRTGQGGAESPETGELIFDWYAWRAWEGKRYGGHSEEDAIQEMAAALKLPLWNEKGWE